ncbi:MAG TPA: hypothetical protein VF288_10510 [Mycobacteriales bacterium]
MRLASNTVAGRIRTQLSHDWNVAGPYQWGTVTAVNTSPNSVDVKMDGSDYVTPGVRYMSGYSPTVGDVVFVARMQGSSRTARVVHGKLA